jgi:hypothetical protein
LRRSEDSEFQLPISRPWNSPEVNEWDSTLPFFAARKADLYSFGMLAMWVLFRNHFTSATNPPSDPGADTDLELLQTLKDNDLLFAFAMECAEKEEDLAQEQMDGLALFFSWTLSPNILTRQLSSEDHEAAERMFLAQRNADPSAGRKEEVTTPEFTTLTSLGIMCTDIEGYHRPFGYLQYVNITLP